MRRVLILAIMALALTACGKKGELEHRDCAKPTYPKVYPSR